MVLSTQTTKQIGSDTLIDPGKFLGKEFQEWMDLDPDLVAAELKRRAGGKNSIFPKQGCQDCWGGFKVSSHSVIVVVAHVFDGVPLERKVYIVHKKGWIDIDVRQEGRLNSRVVGHPMVDEQSLAMLIRTKRFRKGLLLSPKMVHIHMGILDKWSASALPTQPTLFQRLHALFLSFFC